MPQLSQFLERSSEWRLSYWRRDTEELDRKKEFARDEEEEVVENQEGCFGMDAV